MLSVLRVLLASMTFPASASQFTVVDGRKLAAIEHSAAAQRGRDVATLKRIAARSGGRLRHKYLRQIAVAIYGRVHIHGPRATGPRPAGREKPSEGPFSLASRRRERQCHPLKLGHKDHPESLLHIGVRRRRHRPRPPPPASIQPGQIAMIILSLHQPSLIGAIAAPSRRRVPAAQI